jgi:hypothetical protein
MEFRDYKNLTDDEKQFWQFEQLSHITTIKCDIVKMEKRMNFVYAWATGVAAGVSFIFIFVKAKFIDK